MTSRSPTPQGAPRPPNAHDHARSEDSPPTIPHEPSTGNLDPFIANSIYPEADQLFSARLETLSEVKDKCFYILDTNALLVPYNTGREILNEIRRTYERLIAEKRLVIPGQVAREFARNRGRKLADLHQELLDRKSRISKIEPIRHPLMEAAPPYKEALALAEQTNKAATQYGQKIDELIAIVRDWYWNDPVSELYRSVFKPAILSDPRFELTQVRQDLDHRYLHQIPPGYKDASKPDAGIGDILIWKTILHEGKERKQPCVLVSGEEKADWFIRSADYPLYPRYELVDEYRRASSGSSFHILRFSALLALYGATPQVVQQVSSQERRAQATSTQPAITPEHVRAIYHWAEATYPGAAIQIADQNDPCDLRVYTSDDLCIGIALLRSRDFPSALESWYANARSQLKPKGDYDKFHAFLLTRLARSLRAPLRFPHTRALAQRLHIALSAADLSADDCIIAIRPLCHG